MAIRNENDSAIYGIWLISPLTLPVMEPLAIENLWYVLFNSNRPGFGLFGRRKIQEIPSLPPRSQCLKSIFQIKIFIQLPLKFFWNGKFGNLLIRHFQPCFFNLNGFMDKDFQDELHVHNSLNMGEPNQACRLGIFTGSIQNAMSIRQKGTFKKTKRTIIDEGAH